MRTVRRSCDRRVDRIRVSRFTAVIQHDIHADHPHAHGDACGHTAIRHDDHVDFIHDGHLHRVHDDHVDEHALAVSNGMPAACDTSHACGGHASEHRHDASCGHESLPHGDHTDYLVEGHLHNTHGDHCDDHGRLILA